MLGGKANKYSLASSAVPLRDFLTILQTRVKHINRTPKDVSTRKTRAREFYSRK
jgi:hypothetical protein